MHRPWKHVGLFLVVCGILTPFTDWGYLTMHAHTDWEKRMTQDIYFLVGLLCFGIYDILERLERR